MTRQGGDPERGYLTRPRYEVLPLRGALEASRSLPANSTITVTSSPAKGLDATIDLAVRLRMEGHHAVPHLAARLIPDRKKLCDVLDELAECDISEAFVVGGDSAKPAGEFTEAISVLRAMRELDKRPERVGITGYPEPHPQIPDTATIAATDEKSSHADYIVSQICFDANTTATWIKSLRARGVELPVYIGIPGAVDTAKLLRISMKIGLGDSMRYLRKQHGVGKLVTGYSPDRLVDELSPCLSDPEYGIAGWHINTFNEIAKTQRWLEHMGQLGSGGNREGTA